MSKRRWTDPAKRVEQVVRFREAGWSFRKIAADLNVSVGTVHRDLSLWAQRQTELMISDVQSDVQPPPENFRQLNTGLNGGRP